MVAWRVRGLPTDNKVTLEAQIERQFRQSFGSNFHGVRANHLEQAIDQLCCVLATPEESICSRLNTIIARLVATVGHGASHTCPADVAALMSALELARIKNAV
ncbi:hypothetical protein D3C78_1555170 [compost metagenome]